MKTFICLVVVILSVSGTTNDFIQTESRSITNLYDAFSKDSTLTKDFGFSCLIRYGGKDILFDAGSNADIFRDNILRMGIDLKTIDAVVVSHGHFDHLNGLDYVLKVNPQVKIYFPNDIFWGAPVPFDATGPEPGIADSLPEFMRYFDGKYSRFTIAQSGRFWGANIEFVRGSVEIMPGLRLIATASTYMGYFSCYPGKSFVEGQFDAKNHDCRNTQLPELSLSLDSEKGKVLITGCSHTGVDRIIEETLKVTGDSIDMVYGGFHMIPFDRAQTLQQVRHIREGLGVKRVAPAHCTGHLAFKLLQEAYGSDYLYAGLGQTIAF